MAFYMTLAIVIDSTMKGEFEGIHFAYSGVILFCAWLGVISYSEDKG